MWYGLSIMWECENIMRVWGCHMGDAEDAGLPIVALCCCVSASLWTAYPWMWRHHNHSKHREPLTQRHCVTSLRLRPWECYISYYWKFRTWFVCLAYRWKDRVTRELSSYCLVTHFLARSQSCEKLLLALSCPSDRLYVRLCACNNSTPTGRSLMIFDFRPFSNICRENSSFIKIRLE
jgi:hypothetical protein